MHGANMKNLC